MSAPAREIVIQRAARLRLAPWAELHAYRDLFWLLVWRDLASRYKQTVLGPVWYVAQPVLTTVVFTVVFGRVAHIGTAGAPPVLFYLSGLLIWSYFSSSFGAISTALNNNASLFGKVYFPRLLVPLSSLVSNLVALAIQAAVFLAFFVAYKLGPAGNRFALSSAAPLLPLVLIQVAALSLGAGLWVAAFTARFRDFAIVSGFLLQLWLYATPIIYPLSSVPLRWRAVAALNPMTMPVEWTHRALLGTAAADPRLGILSVAVTAAVLLSGLALFAKAERTFIDVV